LKRCIDLTDDQIDAALVSREATGELLGEMAKVARPKEGAPKILFVLARAARQKCAWLGGPLLVQIVPAGEKTEVRIATDRGGGVVVALFAKQLVDAPFSEFERSLKVAARMVEPLRVYPQEGKIVLAPNRRMSTSKMPAVFEMKKASAVLDFS